MSLPAIDRLVHRFSRRVRIYVGDQQICVDLLSAWDQRRLHRVSESLAAEADFDSALKALGTALQSVNAYAGGLRGLGCDVIVADRWLLYEVVPIDIGQVSMQGATAAVAATLADVAGIRADVLDVRWQWQRDGASALAMAIPRAWHSKLRTQLDDQGVSTASVTGEFVAVFNAQRKHLSGPRVVLAVNRESGTQVALMAAGSISSTAFEHACTGVAELVRTATNAMRARGEDTTAEIDYVVDPGAQQDTFRAEPPAPGRWSLVGAPDWAVAP